MSAKPKYQKSLQAFPQFYKSGKSVLFTESFVQRRACEPLSLWALELVSPWAFEPLILWTFEPEPKPVLAQEETQAGAEFFFSWPPSWQLWKHGKLLSKVDEVQEQWWRLKWQSISLRFGRSGIRIPLGVGPLSFLTSFPIHDMYSVRILRYCLYF